MRSVIFLFDSNLALRFWRSGLSTALSMFVLFAASPCLAKGTSTSFGTNVEPTLYYNPDGMYVDMFMHSTGWWNNNAKITLNPDGMLASGSATNLINTAGYPSGDYLFYGEGEFTIDFRGSAYGNWPNNGTVPGTQVTINNITTAVVQITVPPPETIEYGSTGQAGILIDLTVNNPSNPPKNFHLICPGYKAWPNTNATFTKQFLQAVRPFTCFRMMDWMGTNGSKVSTWASRPQPDVFGCSNAGAAYERFIELANTTNRDLWINIPGYATDDWAEGMAKLLKANLKPGLHVYIEYSNECWNWGFPQWYPIETWDQSNSALTTTAAWARHGQETAYLLMHFVQIMQPIMGSQARFILAGQFGNPLYCSAGLAWIQQVYGPPKNYLYGIAGAPYFGGSGDNLDDLFASMNSGMASIAQGLQQNVALAKQYNLKYCCYESGQGLVASEANFALFLAAQQDPRMGTLYDTYGGIMNSTGVDLCNFFNFIGGWSKYGFWGATPDIRETITNPTVKYAAEAALANGGSQNISVTSINSKETKAEAKAAAKAAEAKARAAAEATKIKAAEARAIAEAARHKKHR